MNKREKTLVFNDLFCGEGQLLEWQHIFLKDMPRDNAKRLFAMNKATLDSYLDYLQALVDQIVSDIKASKPGSAKRNLRKRLKRKEKSLKYANFVYTRKFVDCDAEDIALIRDMFFKDVIL